MELVRYFLTQNPCYVANVNKADNRYTTFQSRGPLGLMLHSVGCAQPNATVFLKGWNKPTYDRACVHGIIDANTGVAYQCLPWNYRGWHGGGSSNNTHVGVEMCESKYIRYLVKGDPGYSPGKFAILDKTKARADCKRCYDTAVELFAFICKQYNLDPLTAICSHKEGHSLGIASNHGDPEHYWKGLGMSYTMDGFRQAVKAAINGAAPSTQPTGEFKVGDLVKITGTKYYSGASVPAWVKAKNWYVYSVNGDRIVVNKSEDGKAFIMSPFHAADLAHTAPNTNTIIEVGDLVKITGKHYYSGATIPGWVLNKNWFVYNAPANSDRVVINKSEDGKRSIMSSVNRNDLKIVRKHQ